MKTLFWDTYKTQNEIPCLQEKKVRVVASAHSSPVPLAGQLRYLELHWLKTKNSLLASSNGSDKARKCNYHCVFRSVERKTTSTFKIWEDHNAGYFSLMDL